MMSMRTTLFVFAAGLTASSDAPAQTAAAKVAEKKAAMLEPSSKIDARGYATGPIGRSGPVRIESPDPGLAIVAVLPPVAPLPERATLPPRPAAEALPLLVEVAAPVLPVATLLPGGSLVKQAGVNVQSPLPLPILGIYVSDRVSVADPSLEISTATILMPQNPERLAQVSFAPVNLPDPFEHIQTIRLREPWAENPDLPLFIGPPTRTPPASK